MYDFIKNKIIRGKTPSMFRLPFVYSLGKAMVRCNLLKFSYRSAAMTVEYGMEQIRRIFKGRSPYVWVSAFFPTEFLHALDIVSFSPEVISALITSLGFQNNFLEEAESRWWSRDNCSFHRCAMGGLISNFYPVPAAFCASSHLCEGGVFLFNNLARRYHRPFILLDTPLDNNDNSLLYVTRQLQKIITLLEGVAGTRLRVEKLEEAVFNTEKTRQAMLKVNELRRHPYSPLRSKDAFAYLYLYFTGMGSRVVPGIYETLAAELEKKIKESQNSKGGETSPRYRLLWMHLQPFYQNGIMDYLEANGAELVFEDFSHVYWESWDPGRPLEYIANRMLAHFNYGRIERRIKVIKELARRYNVDGVIHFSHWGCRQSCGSLNIIRNSLQEEGLPFLVLDGDCVDSRNFASGQVQTRIDGFLEMLA
ncbi:MAG TPA: 2-hydroxyacyl-CoA dehydratase [Firmicutes bacterium]|jgi:benzoyl-CoA reductase/2-hydroxyglutaryl-CoA dehydratase subunit BcrC/BadD/HgdB|nr:2-hydroxyacyl-CoA dehydratase [Bacillota bacterium]